MRNDLGTTRASHKSAKESEPPSTLSPSLPPSSSSSSSSSLLLPPPLFAPTLSFCTVFEETTWKKLVIFSLLFFSLAASSFASAFSRRSSISSSGKPFSLSSFTASLTEQTTDASRFLPPFSSSFLLHSPCWSAFFSFRATATTFSRWWCRERGLLESRPLMM